MKLEFIKKVTLEKNKLIMLSKVLKLSSAIACLTLFYSCQPNEQEGDSEVNYLMVEKLIMDFTEDNPDWNQNDVIRKRSCDSLAQKLVPLILENLYEDIPFKFKDITKYNENGETGYLALFDIDKSKFKYERVANNIMLSVFGIVNESMINELKNGKIYYLKGKPLKIKSNFSMLNEIKVGERSNKPGTILLPNIRMLIEEIIPVEK